MSKQTVLLFGATGETGSVILDALVEDESFDVTCFVRTASAGKPSVQKLKDRGVKIVTGDIDGPQDKLVSQLGGIDTVIAALYAPEAKQQIPLVDAAVAAGVKRFVPCNWATPAPRGIMTLRDIKEDVHDHILRAKLGYTIIDVGFWYSISFMTVPSGKFDYAAMMPSNTIVAGGTAPNMFTDMVDVGRLTARIIKDKRTLNKRVVTYGAVLSQNDIRDLIEKKTGETVKADTLSAEEAVANLEQLRKAAQSNPDDHSTRLQIIMAEYNASRYVNADNSPESAAYLGYIDTRDLFPDYKFKSYPDFIDELIAGKVKRPYPDMQL